MPLAQQEPLDEVDPNDFIDNLSDMGLMAKYSEDIEQLARMCYKRLVMMSYDSHVCTSELLSEIEEGGALHDQCDDWSYHLKLDTDKLPTIL